MSMGPGRLGSRPVDVLETETEVLIFCALPGVDPESVDAVIEGGALLVSGKRVLPEELRTALIHQLELPQGRFARRIPLPPSCYDTVKRQATQRLPAYKPPKIRLSRGTARWIMQIPANRRNQRRKLRKATPQPSDSNSLLILPVRETVLFPGVLFPISIGRPVSIGAVQQAMREERQIGIVMQRDGEVLEPSGTDMHRVGTVANIVRYVTAPDGGHHVIVQGIERFRIVDFVQERPLLVANVQRIPEATMDGPEIEARTMLLRQQAIEALELLPQVPGELVAAMQNAQSASALTDLTAAYMDIPPDQKQEILETIDLPLRMDKVSRLLSQRIEVLRLSQEIGRQTKAVFDERQREAVLREQMAAIQRQLGEGDGKSAEVAELNEAITKAQMPPEVEAQMRKELRRYERMPEQAGETGMLRTYLDTMVELPWALPEEKPINIADARRILEEDHFGLEKIKQRIIEYLAVRKLAPQGKAPILCFVGPPGVGEDIAWPIHRARDAAPLCAGQPGRRP